MSRRTDPPSLEASAGETRDTRSAVVSTEADPPSLEASAGETRDTRSAVVSTEADDDWDLRHEASREHRLPLWRRLLTIALAAVFTVVMMSLGLIRHKHDHFDGPLLSPPLPSTVQNGAPP